MEEKRLGYYFKTMANEMTRNRNRALEKIGLTGAQADVLMYLVNRNEEQNQKDIEQYFGLTNPTVSGIINRLEAKKFIEKQVSNKDNRYKKIVPTDKSFKVYNDMKEKMQELEKKLLKGITDEDLIVFRKIAKQLHDNLLDIDGKDSII